MLQNRNFYASLQQDGFAMLVGAVAPDIVESLIQLTGTAKNSKAVSQRKQKTFAIRNLLHVCPAMKTFAESQALKQYIEPVLGNQAKPVRGIFFDKVSSANWKVAWHQDVTIAVKAKKEVPGFNNWTIKAGIPHVQPPREVLESILTLRIHLDDADNSNGALKVIPSTYQQGLLSSEQIQTLSSANESVLCAANRGDILLMKPLLLHASSSGTAPKHRRVIHLEFSALELPYGLDWFGT